MENSINIDNSKNTLDKINTDVDIFICAHKDFKIYPNNDVYKIIHGHEKINVPLEQIEEGDSKISKMQTAFGEGSRMYWLWKNWNFKKYIGICHYRRYFSFFDKVPNIDELFKTYDIIIKSPIYCSSVYQDYAKNHNINDLMIIKNIIKEKFTDYYEAFDKACNGNILYACNMFIMKSDDYKEYCSFVFGVLKEFINEREFKTDDDIKKYVADHLSEYFKNFGPSNTVEYQSRMCGFLLERLTNAYVSFKFKNPKCYSAIEFK